MHLGALLHPTRPAFVIVQGEGRFRCLLRSNWVIAQLALQNRLENRTSCNSFPPDFHVSGAHVSATCHTLRLTHVQGNRQVPCGRIVSCSGAFTGSICPDPLFTAGGRISIGRPTFRELFGRIGGFSIVLFSNVLALSAVFLRFSFLFVTPLLHSLHFEFFI